MMDPSRIQEIIEAKLSDCTALIHNDMGDGEHFAAEVVSPDFDGLNLIRQHQLVYGALGDHMKSDIHALSLKTYTPAQWANRA
jgi:stress-induced morphogen